MIREDKIVWTADPWGLDIEDLWELAELKIELALASYELLVKQGERWTKEVRSGRN